MATKKIISAGTGRRKTAVARVTLVEGKGEWRSEEHTSELQSPS